MSKKSRLRRRTVQQDGLLRIAQLNIINIFRTNQTKQITEQIKR